MIVFCRMAILDSCPLKSDFIVFMAPFIDTLLVFTYAFVCLLFGLRLVRFAKVPLNLNDRRNWLVAVCTSFLLGQAVLAAVWKLIAVAGFFVIPLVLIISVMVALPGITLVFQLIRPMFSNIKNEIRGWSQEYLLWKFAIILVFMPITIYAVHTYMPPHPREDALAFYMAYPRLIAATGDLSIFPTGYASFAQIGLKGEFHYAVMMLFGNFRNPELFTWLTALAGVGILIPLADMAGMGRRGKWILVIIAFTSSAYTHLIWNGKVDIFSAALGLAAYYWAFQVQDGNRGAIRLSGVLTGFAIIAKISYAIFLPITVALIIFWRLYLNKRETDTMRHMVSQGIQIGLILAFWGALPALPHMIKNTALFDDPLAPVISLNDDVLEESWFSNEDIANQSWFSAETTNRILLFYPIALTFGTYWSQLGQLSPILLAFIPLLLLIRLPNTPERRTLFQISAAALIAMGLWLVSNASVLAPRYMFSPLILWFIPVAFGAEWVSQRYHQFKRVIPLVLSATIIIFLFKAETSTRYAFDILLGRRDLCSYEVIWWDGGCRLSRIVNAEADEGTRILSMYFYTYWYRPDLTQCSVNSFTIADEENMWEDIRDHDVEYVIVDTSTHYPMYRSFIDNVPEWATLDPFFEESSYLGFRVTLDPLMEATPRHHCVETSPNIWEVQAIGDKEV